MLLPASAWYLFLLIIPLAITVVFSFGRRASAGGYEPAFQLDNYAKISERVGPIGSTLQLALLGTIICVVLAVPFAYFLATRTGRWKSLLIVLVIVPFWTSFLIRTYAWRTILGSDGLAGGLENVLGVGDISILGTTWAILGDLLVDGVGLDVLVEVGDRVLGQTEPPGGDGVVLVGQAAGRLVQRQVTHRRRRQPAVQAEHASSGC